MKYKFCIKNVWHPIIHRKKKGYLEFNSVEEIVSWLESIEKEYQLRHNVYRISTETSNCGDNYLMTLSSTKNRYEVSLKKVGKQKGVRSICRL